MILLIVPLMCLYMAVLRVMSTGKRYFSHQRIMLLLAILLQFNCQDESNGFRNYFEEDQQYCPDCFRAQAEDCHKFFDAIAYDPKYPLQYLLHYWPTRLKHFVHHLIVHGTELRVIAKYLIRVPDEIFHQFRNVRSPTDMFYAFYGRERYDGMQFCPGEAIHRFMVFLNFSNETQITYDDLTLWFYMYFNVQPVLLPQLEARGFPVPATYAVCGFTLYQQHAGRTLKTMYGTRFRLRLKIAEMLLKLAADFSNGVDGFRMYITDLSPDNIAYDTVTDRVYIIDLDTIIIVDSTAIVTPPLNPVTQRHFHHKCHNCFAFSTASICSHKLSDINIFSVCLLLREDLEENRTKGFLYPVPKWIESEFPQFTELLNECVDCPEPECQNRFQPAEKLRATIKDILLKYTNHV